MAERVISIKCKGSRMAPLASLEIIQGELKELSEANYAKLRKRIEAAGFDAPFFVWGNKILDGTQRKRVLEKMLADGWKLHKGQVPVCDIEAESLEDAKARLLHYVSQYGKLTDEGLYAFISGMEEMPDLETVDFPDFDMAGFTAGYLGGGPDFQPTSEDDQFRLDEKAKVKCPECGHEFTP